MSNCFRPDQVMRSGSIAPAGCYMHIQNTVRDIARDFTRDPAGVARQYANVPSTETLPGNGGVVPSSRPSFLARFFGAR
jgi:hypothetical protein